ncbi:hypothetical protein [Flavobacterium psychrophilum]|uniref:Uncharacterized protein n=1 Tax=Flavobacterium psychrophilum TaxID=96345 RepID=A0A7U2NFL8_FLAPS|nr:hypothetical protein [Flavobacterium psychrophilum]OAE92320.1 hypothetical protein SU65_10160 [Flavobacterium psychrophilum]QRE04177.1 hypothetical protein H0H26_00800 [Flavobacterium psychrophilum]
MALTRQQGALKNKLLRYKEIVNEYQSHNTQDIPLTVIWKKHIYPKYYISIGTLYNALNEPIEKQLKEIALLE